MRNRTSRALALFALALGCAHPAAVPVGGPSTLDLVVVGTTDIHGRARGWNYESGVADPLRGLSRAATIVDSVRATAPGRVVLLDAGDLLQGNAFDFVAARVAPPGAPHPLIAAMNAMHYDASAIGNHEFNFGLPFLIRSLEQSKHPFLAANAFRPDGAPAFPGWIMIERGGVHIGIVGATTPGSMVWDRDNLRGRVVLRDIVPEVRRAVGEARADGADVVLVTMHSGLNEKATYDTVTTNLPSDNVAERVAREVPGVDMILYGHSHKEMADTTINGVLLMQPKNWVESVAIAHLGLVREAGKWRATSKRASLVQAKGHAESPVVLAATEQGHRATLSWVSDPVGRTPVTWRADSARVADTPLIDFILGVMRKATGADLASTAAFSLDAAIDSGAITAARVQALYPYDNTVKVISIDGRQLREYLEYSARYFRTTPGGVAAIDSAVPGYNFDIVAGVDYTLDLSQPVGARVTRLERGGKPVAPDDRFTLALTNYRQAGGGGFSMLAGAPLVSDKQLDIRQLLFDEIKRVGTLRPEDYFVRNWRIEPSSAVASLYAEMNPRSRSTARPAQPSGAAPSAAPVTATAPARLARPATRLRIIGTNDFHGALEPRPDNSGKRRGGAAYMAAAIEKAAAECVRPACETILLDGGDEFQGTPASNFAFGRPVAQIFNQLGYAASALGNHEFDWGQDTLRARMRDVRYRFLGSNVRYADGRDVPWIQDDTLVTRGKLKIGVIGVASILTASTTRTANVADLRFLEPAPIVDSLARRLRARGADYVVVVAHDGAYCDRTGTASCRGEIVTFAQALREPIDAIISGHTHSLIDATINGVPVVQAYTGGTAIDVVDLGPGGTTYQLRNVLTDSIAPDPAIASIVRRAVNKVAPMVNRKIATIATELTRDEPQYPLGNLITDAMRKAGKGDVAVMNNGGIRATMRAGVATYGSLFEIQPFTNILYRITVTGAALRNYLERLVQRDVRVHVSGVAITYDSTRAAGSRIVSVVLADGRQIDPAAHYSVILNDFLATGGEGLGLANNASKSEPLGISDLDALIGYLRSLPQPVRAPTEVRIVNQAAKR